MLTDLHHALRWLRRRPLATGAVVATLALGLGAVTTAFTLLHGILLSPLAYPQPEQLVQVHQTLDVLRESPNPRLAAMWNRVPVSYLDAADLRQRSRALAEVGLYQGRAAVLQAEGAPEEVRAARIEPQLLEVLAVPPRLGRAFTVRDVEARSRVVLLAHDLWRSAFAADPAVVGRTVRVDGEPHEVVGVMPSGFRLPARDDRLWTPLAPGDDDRAFRDEHAYGALARLAPGASLDAARDEATAIAGSLAGEHPQTNAGKGFRLVPLLETVVADAPRVLALLVAAALAVLLVACVDVTLLLLAQGEERRSRLALRLALGASRTRLLRRLLVEVGLLAVAGVAGGLVLAAAGLRLLPVLLVEELPRLDEVGLDGPVVLFAVAAGLVAVLGASLLPALRLAGVDLRGVLGEGRLRQGGGPAASGALVAAQVALTLVLATAALGLGRGWLELATADPGFETGGVLVQELRLPGWSYGDEGLRRDFAARLVARLEALPGVAGVALTSRLPRPGPAEVWGYRIAGRDPESADWTQGRSATMQFVTPGWFEVMGVPRLAGSGFTEGAAGVREVVVDRSLARQGWPGREPVGERVVMGGEEYRVVGVMGDVGIRGAVEGEELMVQPWHQRPPASMAILVKGEGAVAARPLERAEAVRRAIRELDPALPLPPAVTLEEVASSGLAGPRAQALLAGLSAGVALFLALVGTWGVASYTVGRRRREIGVRLALGASRGRVRRRFLGWAAVWIGGGLVVGAVGALAAGRLLAGLLVGLVPGDRVDLLPSLAVAALLLAVAALLAAWLPIRRASRLDPAAVLRAE